MKILSFGSLNMDRVYTVDHFVHPGETLRCESYEKHFGGKGCNQSIALARAGADVYHAGKIGTDGDGLITRMGQCGVCTSLIEKTDGVTGHAVIQVNREGENAIIIHGGANRSVDMDYITRVMKHFSKGDYLLLQNEINNVDEIMRQSGKKGLTVVFNPAPVDAAVLDYPLDLVDCFILNEIEGTQLTGEKDPERIVSAMAGGFQDADIVLTRGANGVLFGNGRERISLPAQNVVPVDTTAAGDTFVGYFIAEIMNAADPKTALDMACRAAAICVTRKGAADAIPRRFEVVQTGTGKKVEDERA